MFVYIHFNIQYYEDIFVITANVAGCMERHQMFSKTFWWYLIDTRLQQVIFSQWHDTTTMQIFKQDWFIADDEYKFKMCWLRHLKLFD